MDRPRQLAYFGAMNVEADGWAVVPQDFPALAALAWNRDPSLPIAAREAFSLYEHYWRHVDEKALDPAERKLIDSLAERFGDGRLLVSR